MKLIIAGSRDISGLSKYFFRDLIVRHFELNIAYPDNPHYITEIVSGGARGIDECGERFARGYYIRQKVFPYRSELGPAGGPIRNKEMAEYADALLLVWDGKSRGSASMKREMEKLDKPIYEVIIRG